MSWKHNEPNDSWQDRYFDPASMASLERQFWVSEGEPLAARVPKFAIKKRRGSVFAPGEFIPTEPGKGKPASRREDQERQRDQGDEHQEAHREDRREEDEVQNDS